MSAFGGEADGEWSHAMQRRRNAILRIPRCNSQTYRTGWASRY